MIHILVVTHGKLAEGLVDSAKMLIGNPENVDFISFTREMGQDQLDDVVGEKLSKFGEGEQVLFLCDLLGGTPFKVCSKYSFKKENMSVFYGVNLPILIETIVAREGKTLEELTTLIDGASSETIGLSQM